MTLLPMTVAGWLPLSLWAGHPSQGGGGCPVKGPASAPAARPPPPHAESRTPAAGARSRPAPPPAPAVAYARRANVVIGPAQTIPNKKNLQ